MHFNKSSSHFSLIGSCCNNDTCGVYRSGYRCKLQTDCQKESTCDGRTFLCNDPPPKENLTECGAGHRVCMGGFCTGSPCLKYGLTGCICPDAAEHCHLCCIYNGNCISTYKIPSVSIFIPYVVFNAYSMKILLHCQYIRMAS